MFISFLALAALAGAQSGFSVKWVPLNKANPTAQSVQREKIAPQPAPVVAPANATPEAPSSAPAVRQAEVSPVAIAKASDVPGRLDLTCLGGGTANKAAVASAFSSGHASGSVGFTSWSGSGSGTTTVVGQRQQAFGDQVDVRLFGGDDRIRIPRTMLPAIRGGKEGWFKLKDVVADARSIRASAAVNMLNNPKVFIDRVTGTISISGKAGDYTGQCQAIDASAPAKF